MAKSRKVTPPVPEREPESSAVDLVLCVAAAALVGVSALVSGQMLEVQRLSVSVAAAALVGLPLGLALLTGRVSASRIPYPLLLALAMAATAAAALATVSPGRTIDRALELLSALFVFAAIITTARRSPRTAAGIAFAGVAAGGVLASVVAGHEYAQHFRMNDPLWRVFGTFYNPGFLAGYLVVSIPATLGLLAVSSNRAASFGLGFCSVLQIAAVALTGARAGILALVVGIAVLFASAVAAGLLRSSGAARVIAALVIALVVGVVVGRPTGGRVEKATEEGHSFQFRVYTWEGTAKMASANALAGMGPGTFEIAFYPYSIAGYTRLAHSDYFQGAAEHGIPAWGLQLAWWMAVVLLGARTLLQRSSDEAESWLLSGALAATAATSVRGVFDSDWWCLPILLACAACTAAIAGMSCSGRATLGRSVVGAVLLVSALVELALGAPSVKSAAESALASALETQERYSDAEISWRSAAGSAPWNAAARMRAAQYLAMAEGGFPREAREELERLRKLEPTNPKIPRAQAELALRAGEESAATKYIRDASRLDPKSPRVLLDLARTLEATGERQEALQVYRRMLQVEASPYGTVRALPQLVEPYYAWAHAEVGNELVLAGDGEGARKHWSAAAALLKRYFKSLETSGDVLEAAGMRDPDLEKDARRLQQVVKSKLSQTSRK